MEKKLICKGRERCARENQHYDYKSIELHTYMYSRFQKAWKRFARKNSSVIWRKLCGEIELTVMTIEYVMVAW